MPGTRRCAVLQWLLHRPKQHRITSRLQQTPGGHEGSPRCSRRAAGTVRCAANYTPLSPISFVERAAAVYGVRTAVVYGERRHSWRETRDRCVRVAAALATRFGLARGDVVRRPFSCFAYHVCKLQVACESDASTNSQILLSQSCPLRKR